MKTEFNIQQPMVITFQSAWMLGVGCWVFDVFHFQL